MQIHQCVLTVTVHAYHRILTVCVVRHSCWHDNQCSLHPIPALLVECWHLCLWKVHHLFAVLWLLIQLLHCPLVCRIHRGAVTPDEDPGLFFTSHQGSTLVSNVHVSAMGTIWTQAGDQPAKAFEPAVSK